MLYYDGIFGWESIIKNNIGSYLIFAYYLGGSFTIGKAINSPLRKDENPSFTIFEGTDGLMYKDFATGEAGDCIKFVQELYDISRNKSIIKILSELYHNNLGVNTPISTSNTYTKIGTTIGLKTKEFDPRDLRYWAKYNIDKTILDKFDVVCCSHVWINNTVAFYTTKEEPIYAYLTNKHIKTYRPKSKRAGKWGGNTNTNDVFGLKQLEYKSDTLIITKSGKDVMTLYSLGYESISPNSETAIINKDVIDNLKSKYKYIYVLMDNDTAGKIAGSKYKDVYQLNDIYLPTKEKDISDYIDRHTVEETKELIQSLLKQ